MDISSQIIPAGIILIASLLSGKHGTSRWETVTAFFGWGACLGFIFYGLALIFFSTSQAVDYVLQFSVFCLITALSRDYEKILRPLFPWNKS